MSLKSRLIAPTLLDEFQLAHNGQSALKV